MPLQHMAKETEMQMKIFAETDSKHGDMVYIKDVFATPCCLIASCIVWILPSIPTMDIKDVLTNDLGMEMMHAFISACCVFAGVLSGFHLTPIFCCALNKCIDLFYGGNVREFVCIYYICFFLHEANLHGLWKQK